MTAGWSQRVEHVDTDASGVVHFSRYASLLETALLETLEAADAGPSAMASRGAGFAVTELRMVYRAPARFRDLLVGRFRLDHVGGARIRARGSLYRGEPGGGQTVLVEGELILGLVESATGRPAPLPAPVRDVLKGLVRDE